MILPILSNWISLIFRKCYQATYFNCIEQATWKCFIRLYDCIASKIEILSWSKLPKSYFLHSNTSCQTCSGKIFQTVSRFKSFTVDRPFSWSGVYRIDSIQVLRVWVTWVDLKDCQNYSFWSNFPIFESTVTRVSTPLNHCVYINTPQFTNNFSVHPVLLHAVLCVV